LLAFVFREAGTSTGVGVVGVGFDVDGGVDVVDWCWVVGGEDGSTREESGEEVAEAKLDDGGKEELFVWVIARKIETSAVVVAAVLAMAEVEAGV